MKWITIEKIDNGGRKTDVFEVWSIYDSYSLGLIKWKANWRKYAFFPYTSTCFEQVCLKDIAEFIEKETREYKKDWVKL